MQPLFCIHLLVKWGEYLAVYCRTNADMETGYKPFKASVMKSIQIEEHRFGVEPEIVAELACTAVSQQHQRDVARCAARATSSRKSRSTFSTRSCRSSCAR